MSKDATAFDWYLKAGLGIFLHWGIYSLLGRGEQVLFRERLRPSEYRRLANASTRACSTRTSGRGSRIPIR